jgi:hypothetical protein
MQWVLTWLEIGFWWFVVALLVGVAIGRAIKLMNKAGDDDE